MSQFPKIIVILFSLSFSLISKGQAGTLSPNSIKLGAGIGASMGQNTEGGGIVYAVGYQRELWKDRLRINPNLSIGHYSTKFILDTPDQYFNSMNLEVNLFYDLIKVKAFSLLIGTGALVNNSRGLTGTGGDPGRSSSIYVNDFHFGGYAGGGIRINPSHNRMAFNILPFNLHFGPNYFMEFHAKMELDVKL